VAITSSRELSLTPLIASTALTIRFQEDLLQLDLVSLDRRQALRELGLQRDAIPQQLAACQGDHIEDDFVDV